LFQECQLETDRAAAGSSTRASRKKKIRGTKRWEKEGESTARDIDGEVDAESIKLGGVR
jgi:hypothetical protein